MLSHKALYGIMEALPLGLGKTEFNPGFRITPMTPGMKRLGKKTFGMLSQFTEHREQIASLYSSVLEGSMLVHTTRGARPVYHRFPVMAGSGFLPDRLIRLGVRRMYPRAIVDEPSIRPFLSVDNSLTFGASMIAENLVTLPTHLGISMTTARHIASTTREVFAC